MAHRQIHRREPQIGNGRGAPSSSLPGNIAAPSSVTDVSNIVTATSASAMTTVTSQATIISLGANGTPTTITEVQTLTITASSELPSTSTSTSKASSSAATASSTAAKSSSTAAAAASSKSSSNLSTLIPAIVVPVAVVLLASFAVFWFLMRRRHRRELKNAEFVMAGKGEKLSSRSNSSRSTPGTANAEKSRFAVSTSEVRPPTSTAPKLSLDDIGLARPLTPKDGIASRTRSPNTSGRPSRDQARYANFSGPRPSTARNAPPSRGERQQRNRSNSSPQKRGPPPSAYLQNRERDPYGILPPGAPNGRPPPPRPNRGPSPNSSFRGPSPNPGYRNPSPTFNSRNASSSLLSSTRSPPLGSGPIAGIAGGMMGGLPSDPRPAPTASSSMNRMRDPSPTMGHVNRGPAPSRLDAPPPGAFNGASSISQYSPIIKETPNLAAIANSNPSSDYAKMGDYTKPLPKPSNPPTIQTKNLTQVQQQHSNPTSRSPSPLSPSFLSAENMAIARLANSSRLGFNNNTTPSPSADKVLNSFPFDRNNNTTNPRQQQQQQQQSQQHAADSPTTHSSISPKLPPPATRSQLIPLSSMSDFADSHTSKPSHNYFNNSKRGSPTASFAPQMKQRHSMEEGGDRQSIISDLEHYDDIDAKSDVSSLNEFERFEFESDRGDGRGSSAAGSTTGNGTMWRR